MLLAPGVGKSIDRVVGKASLANDPRVLDHDSTIIANEHHIPVPGY